MGADFCFAATPAPVDQHGELLTTTEKGGVMTQIAERLRSIESIDDFILNFTGYEPEEEDDPSTFDYAVEQVGQFINEWRLSRELIVTTFDTDRKWIVSGGMSWGDDPTNEFAVLSFIEATRIFEEPFTIE
mgnify:CR=1 FL=1